MLSGIHDANNKLSSFHSTSVGYPYSRLWRDQIFVVPRVIQHKSSDTIQARSNSDFDIKSATIQFYGNYHNPTVGSG
jgi:hypothetical protein